MRQSQNHRTMIKTLIVVYFLQTLTFISVNCQYNLNSPCTTPDGQPGRCIAVRNCRSLLSLLNAEYIAPDTLQFLRNSACGFEGTEPRVCCRLLPANCGVDLSQRIFGGNKTSLGEFPWMTLIEYTRPYGNSTLCAGSLISSRYVLTAAHCVKGPDISRLGQIHFVRLGEHNVKTNPDCVMDSEDTTICADFPKSVRIEEIIAHENYDYASKSRENDIALLRLSQDVEFTNYIKPVCLPSDANPKQKLIVAGWGRTENGWSSDVKLRVSVPLYDLDQCLQVYKGTLAYGHGQICAGGEKGKDSCGGDSGGPLISPETVDGKTRWSLVGVVSFGPKDCGSERLPGIYTRVSTFKPWIISKMRF